MALRTLERVETQVFDTCPECGVTHGFPESIHRNAINNSRRIYCPNGHRWNYTNTKQHEIDTLELRLKRQQAMTASRQEQITHLEKSRAAFKGELTKTRKKLMNGNCPCCKKHFKSLAKHMIREHPDFCDSLAE